MTKITVSREDVEKALKWAVFVGNNLDKFRGSLDFAAKFLEKASSIGSHYDDDNALYSFFAMDSAKYFYNLAKMIGDEARAKKFEEIRKKSKEIEKQRNEKQRKWDWTKEQASQEWIGFLKENEEKVEGLINFLENELQKEGSDFVSGTIYAAHTIYNMAYWYDDFPQHYAAFKLAKFVDNNKDKFREFLDFATKFLEKARSISSHYDDNDNKSYSSFVNELAKYFYDLAIMIGDETSAKKFEEIRNKESRRKERDWTREQASEEWRGFVKENKEKFEGLIIFLDKLKRMVGSDFAKETEKSADIIYDRSVDLY